MITLAPIDESRLLGDFSTAHPQVGAIVSFTGKVRGEGVEILELEHHPTFSAKIIDGIGRDACARFAVAGCLIAHRVGKLVPGETIVLVAAAGAHRRAAFEAVDYIMDRLKTEAPLWKREWRGGRGEWIEARPSDLTDRARWEEQHAD